MEISHTMRTNTQYQDLGNITGTKRTVSEELWAFVFLSFYARSGLVFFFLLVFVLINSIIDKREGKYFP